jgi:hypothetical protein
MFGRSIAAAVIARAGEGRSYVCSPIRGIVCRCSHVEEIPIGVVDINAEGPTCSGDIDRTIEIVGLQESAILRIRQHPTKIVVANIQLIIIVVGSPCVTHHISVDIVLN